MSPTGAEGDNEGTSYVEYELLDADGAKVSLEESNVVYIKQDGKNLVPNTDTTLWFNISKPSGTYIYEVNTIDGNIYTAILEWIKGD